MSSFRWRLQTRTPGPASVDNRVQDSGRASCRAETHVELRISPPYIFVLFVFVVPFFFFLLYRLRGRNVRALTRWRVVWVDGWLGSTVTDVLTRERDREREKECKEWARRALALSNSHHYTRNRFDFKNTQSGRRYPTMNRRIGNRLKRESTSPSCLLKLHQWFVRPRSVLQHTQYCNISILFCYPFYCGMFFLSSGLLSAPQTMDASWKKNLTRWKAIFGSTR